MLGEQEPGAGEILAGRLGHLAYGGDYNPEQWPEATWEEDVRLMREAGVNLVSLGIFSWSRLQPDEDRFDFAWLDRVMDLLHAGGVAVGLATATASPPPWLSRRHPEILPQLADGGRLWPGARQQYCPSSPVYRAAAGRLAAALAERYAGHPALALWHVGNEYGCHVPACWCEESARDFRDWLRRRYGSLEALNEAWGTDFWSQRYGDWEEVLPPRRTPTWPNPSRQLDFHRFSSDALLACYEVERQALAELTPGVPVTTNFMGFFKPLDYWRWAGREDLVSHDSYPDPADPDSPMRAAMAGDLMRSLGRGRLWLLMEQTTSRVNWRPVNVAKAPGQMRSWSLQAVARGACGVMFFQWRQSRVGAEKFHSAMVPHGPVAGSATWQEVVRLGRDLRRLDSIAGSRVQAEVAITHDWDSWWALELPTKPAPISQLNQLEWFYRPLYEANLVTDFVRPGDDLGRYKLLLAPSLYLVTDEAAQSLRAFVAGGGTLVMSFFSGIVDAAEHIRLGGYPAPFRELLGLTVDDFLPLTEGGAVELRLAGGGRARGGLWSERILLEDAEALGCFADGDLEGLPALTRHRFGRGRAYYLGTQLDQAATAALLTEAAAEAGVRQGPEVPAGVEAVRRVAADASFLFLLNHGTGNVSVPLPSGGTDLLGGGTAAGGQVELGPRGAAVVHLPG